VRLDNDKLPSWTLPLLLVGAGIGTLLGYSVAYLIGWLLIKELFGAL
jgi:hypothetical protein